MYGPAVSACVIHDARIDESSGVVASDLQPDVLFTHNDSGDSARFFALGTDCRTRAVYDLPGVHARDWEDIARGPGHVLWLGDIGDNSSKREHITIHRVAEPMVPASSTKPIDVTLTTFTLRYPDGAHNAETLLCDPLDGRLYVLTKNDDGHDFLYAAALPLTKTSTLTRLDGVTFPGFLLADLTTGGDISPDGSRLVVRTYTDAFELPLPSGSGMRLKGVFGHGLGSPIVLPLQKQGEGIGYSADGRSLYLTSEGLDQPLYVLPPPATPTPTPAPRAQAKKAHSQFPLLGLVALCVAVGLLARRQLRLSRRS